MRKIEGRKPSTHDITIATEDFGEATYYDICTIEDRNVDKVSNCFVNDNSKVVLISKFTETFEIRGYEERIRRKFAEERKDLFAGFKEVFKVVEIFC